MEFSKKKLEQIFADDFSSPVFPVLAEIYFQNKEFQRLIELELVKGSQELNQYYGLEYRNQVSLIEKVEMRIGRIIFENKKLDCNEFV